MKLHISTQNLVLSLSEAIDLIAPSVSYHHRFVACAACQICEAAGIPLPIKKEIIYIFFGSNFIKKPIPITLLSCNPGDELFGPNKRISSS